MMLPLFMQVAPGDHMYLREGYYSTPAKLRERLQAKPGLVCYSDPDDSYVTVYGRAAEGVPEGSKFDRSSRLICDEWRFEVMRSR